MLDATDATRDRHRFETVPMFPVEATGLTFADRGRTLVDGVSLRLERGPRTVVMGPNGAGKSLLLRMLHGIVQPSSGAVTWAGRRGERGRAGEAGDGVSTADTAAGAPSKPISVSCSEA